MATVPTPATQTAGLVVPAATINSQGNLATYLAGRTESGGARCPLCVVQQGVAQSLANATAAAILFDTESVDYDNGHSTVTATDTYTVGTAGWYLISGSVHFATNVTGLRQGWFAKNGVTIPGAYNQVPATSGGPTSMALPATVETFAAGDTIKMFAWQNSTAALLTSVASDSRSRLVVKWISA